MIFDFDGTLIDSSAAIVATFNAVLREYQVQAWSEDRIRQIIGRPLAEMFHQIFPNGQPEQRELIETYVRLSKQNGFEEVQLLPGAREALEHFSPLAKLGIATSRTSGSTREILKRYGLDSRFGAIVGIEMVKKPKPHPEPVEQVLDKLQIGTEGALLVGDTPDDIAAARQAGVSAVGVTSGAHSAESLVQAGAALVIGSLFELLEAIPG